MRILIVGGGGREHALAWRLSKSSSVEALFASPGNPGLAQVGQCIAAPVSITGYADLASSLRVDLTVVGPEAPLVGGIVDEFRARNMPIVGPTQAAAHLEGSKLFAKNLMQRAGIPTARSGLNINGFSFPVVVKADGLASGKGVVIARDKAEAIEAIERLGPDYLLEEYLEGEEVSFIGLSNGREIISFPPTQDHKRLLDGDKGPNTGGMGAYLDRQLLTERQSGLIVDTIMLPAIAEMNREGAPFTGFLYAGLMMTAAGPKVLEFNARLGDPETQALMHQYGGDLAELLASAVRGESLSQPVFQDGCSVCVVAAAENYPGQPRTGDEISGIAKSELSGATVFQAGTAERGGRLVTNGGRVLGITASGSTLQGAIDAAYAGVREIHFAGMQYRTDIGHKGLHR